MRIHEAGKITGLTRKAIEYYATQGLVSPAVLPNGYRDFSTEDVDTLRKISVLRRLGISTQQVRAILADATGQTMQAACVRAELNAQRSQQQQALLLRLARGEAYADVRAALDALDGHRAIIDRLMDAFPGFWGHFLAMHFAEFLDSPIETEAQRAAYAEIIAFLDDVAPLPEDIARWMDETNAQISPEQMRGITAEMRRQISEPQQMLESYRESQKFAGEFHNSDAGKYTRSLKQLLQQNGYFDRFIPAMRRLSPTYAEYSAQLDALEGMLQNSI